MSLTFCAALSVNPAQMRTTFKRLETEYDSMDPLSHIMYTPISSGEQTHKTVQSLVESYDVNVIFDSGGYDVQVGRYDFDELYAYLLDFYGENDWAHRYVLPDNVPVSEDDPETVAEKVDETISASRMCYRRLPASVRERALGVIQGWNVKQLSQCLDAYKQLGGLNHVGFGSFATSGVDHGVNMLTKDAFDHLSWAVEEAHRTGMSVHAFGVGGPTSIPLLAEANIDSFDTTSWMRSSGYGNVFFPFKSRYNASHRKNRGGKTLTRKKLARLKDETGHDCPFCQSMHDLQTDRWERIMHNLIVIHEMTEQIEEMSTEKIISMMDPQSKYRRRLEAVREDSHERSNIVG